MFSYPVLFLFAALIAGWMGFGALSGTIAKLAKFLCVVFLVLFAITMYRTGIGG